MPLVLDVYRHVVLDLLALLFLVSGTVKAVGMSRFRLGLLLLPFMTVPLSYVTAAILPALELTIAVQLYLNVQVAKLVSIGLLLAFAGVALVAMLYHRSIPCGCFGDLDGKLLSGDTIARNLVLVLLVLSVLGLQRRTEWLLTPMYTSFGLLACLVVARVRRNQRFISDLQRESLL